METLKGIRKEYRSHSANVPGTGIVLELRASFSALHDMIEEHITASRERSIAITELEHSAMWAIKAAILANLDENLNKE